jgi:hypothetical protein
VRPEHDTTNTPTRKDDPMTTFTTLLPATDRARTALSSHAAVHAAHPPVAAWRDGSTSPAFLGCGTTGLGAFATNAYVSETNRTVWAAKQMIKRPARHLETRST